MPMPLETVAFGGYDVKWGHVALLLLLAGVAAPFAISYGARLLRILRSWPLRFQLAAGLGTVAVLVGGTLLIISRVDRPGDVLDENAKFVVTKDGEQQIVKRVRWPVYGYDEERTRYLPTEYVHPPYASSLWSYNAGKLLEFSPVAVKERLYVIDKDATMIALDADTGKVDWKQDMGTLNASSPAYDRGKLYGVSLSPGQAFGLRADTGKVDWTTPLAGRSESSPVVSGSRVIVGCECGTLYALDTKEGKIEWTVETGGAIKGGVAVHDGVVFFGNYAGELYAVDVNNGNVKWQTGTQGASFGRTGSIYSTPAIAFGRVYVGSKDSRVYSFVEDSGDLAWSHSTGDEVYPAPAVADPPRAGPTVFIGSLDQNLYALDAEDGHLRWAEHVGGPIIGAASVLGDVVYVAAIGGRTGTVGFDVADGSEEFEHELGEYNPVISDGRRLYLTGSSTIRAFEPKTEEQLQHEREKKLIKAKRERQEAKHKRDVARIKARRKREREAAAAAAAPSAAEREQAQLERERKARQRHRARIRELRAEHRARLREQEQQGSKGNKG